jgi:ribose-phosphate pyrophosphokinase
MRRLTIRIPQDRGPEGLYDLIHYPAGEIQVRLTSEGLRALRRKNEYEIICNPIPDIVELAQLKDALDHAGGFVWKRLFLSYMPYSRADRRFVAGDSHGLGTWALLLNALKFDVVETFDMHSDATLDLINDCANIGPADRPTDQIAPIIRKLGRRDLVLMWPDMGSVRRYNLTKYSLNTALGTKRRDPARGALTGFGVDPECRINIERAKKVLIIDDICDGGGTFIGLSEALHKINPALKLYLYVSHGIFSKGQDELRKHFREIFTSEFSFDGAHLPEKHDK